MGNWLSWHQLDSTGQFAKSLLSRTVLYKVGHHASHNATLKGKGLQMMTNVSRLVAMIPVDQKEAHKPKGSNPDGWQMPYDRLLADLLVRTDGRVMRADTGVDLLDKGKPLGWSKSKWEQFLRDTVLVKADIATKDEKRTKPFFIQYAVRA